MLAIAASAAADRAADAAISQAYAAIPDGYAHKDVAALYSSHAPKYEWLGLKGDRAAASTASAISAGPGK